jgi:hypothetical protein
MEEPTLASIAAMTAQDVLRAHPGLGAAGAEELAHRIETALRMAARQERLACIGECTRRRTLWAETEDRSGTPPSLRTEARFRGNEAAVLADALRARGAA